MHAVADFDVHLQQLILGAPLLVAIGKAHIGAGFPLFLGVNDDGRIPKLIVVPLGQHLFVFRNL